MLRTGARSMMMNGIKYQVNSHMSYVERSLAIACTRGREAVVQRFQKLLSDYRLTEQQWRALRVLYEYEPIPSADLCSYCCIHKVSMARILKYLDSRGLAYRERSPDDKRAYIVRLTDKGRQLLAELTPAANDIYDGIAKDFGEENTEQLLTLLEKLSQINK